MVTRRELARSARNAFVAAAAMSSSSITAAHSAFNADAAGKSQLAINHKKPAMRAPIVFLPVVPLGATKPANVAARVFHSLDQRHGNFFRPVSV